jgi:hypothetical protein
MNNYVKVVGRAVARVDGLVIENHEQSCASQLTSLTTKNKEPYSY